MNQILGDDEPKHIWRKNSTYLAEEFMNTQDVKFPENANVLMYYCDVHLFNIQTLFQACETGSEMSSAKR